MESFKKCWSLPWEGVGWLPSVAHFLGRQPQAPQTSGNQHNLIICAPLQRHKELQEPSPVFIREAKNVVLVKNLSAQKGFFTTAKSVIPAGFTKGSPPKMTGLI